MSCILYSEKGSVAVVTLNRPESLDSFSPSLRSEFVTAMERAAKSAAIRAIVLAATGEACSAGTDPQGVISGCAQAGGDEYIPGVLAIATAPKPVIAAVRGTVGIALSYVLACDFILIGKGSCMQVTFSDLTLVPSGGVGWQIARRLGHQLAFELAMDGNRLSAERCLQLGLANRVAAEERLMNEAEAWAAHFARMESEVIAASKHVLWSGLYEEIERSMRLKP